MVTTEIPAEIAHLEAFLNTRAVETDEEALTDPEALSSWLVARGLVADGATATAHDLEEALRLRESLRALVRRHDDAPSTAARRAASEAAGVLPLRIAFDEAGNPVVEPLTGGVSGALAALLAPLPTAVATGAWQRLKICPDDTCAWAFYDQSRNQSRRWCSMEVCGNRQKSRAFRARSSDDGER